MVLVIKGPQNQSPGHRLTCSGRCWLTEDAGRVRRGDKAEMRPGDRGEVDRPEP